MKVYITKYALTAGIIEREGGEISDSHCYTKDSFGKRDYYHGKDWHKSFEEAKKDAESRRDRKIVSIKKQLAKLEEMEF